MTYDDFFVSATGRAPFPYQRSFALAARLPEALEIASLDGTTRESLFYLRLCANHDRNAGEPRPNTREER